MSTEKVSEKPRKQRKTLSQNKKKGGGIVKEELPYVLCFQIQPTFDSKRLKLLRNFILSPSQQPKTIKPKIAHADLDEMRGNSYLLLIECKLVQPPWNSAWRFKCRKRDL